MDGELFVKFPLIRRISASRAKTLRENADWLWTAVDTMDSIKMADGPEKNRDLKHCAFFLKRKQRFCRMTVGEGKNYCGEHMIIAGEAEVEFHPHARCDHCVKFFLIYLLDSFIYLFVVERWQKKNNVSTWQETVRKERLSYWTTVVWLPLRFAFNQLAVQLRHKMQ